MLRKVRALVIRRRDGSLGRGRHPAHTARRPHAVSRPQEGGRGDELRMKLLGSGTVRISPSSVDR
jgi:hypothetical protein